MAANPYTVSDFVVEDNPRGLFPLESTVLYFEHGTQPIKKYVNEQILDKTKLEASFLGAPVCHALKDPHHLRKLLCLDPVSTFYIYDLVWRKSTTKFQTSKPSVRRAYGYAFKRRKPLSPSTQYHDFRKDMYKLKKKYKFFAKTDISNCFNNFYHHDIQVCISENLSEKDGEHAGQFLREINTGTSVNCFPQGIYPAKTIGNYYLSFIEQNAGFRSDSIIRFLDDIYFFSDKESTVASDVIMLQELLGKHNLYLNAQKTQIGSKASPFGERRIDAVKKRLLRKREFAIGYDGDGNEEVDLEGAERDYLEQIIKEDEVAEEDVELALTLIDQGTTVVRLVELVCEQFPHLIKHLHRVFSAVEFEDDGTSYELLSKRVNQANVTEFELFWIAKMVIDYYEWDEESAEILNRIIKHQNSTSIVKAVVLEAESNKFGFFELKESQLRDSPGNIAGIAALMGLRSASKAKRNHICSYVSKAGLHMKLYSDIVKKL